MLKFYISARTCTNNLCIIHLICNSRGKFASQITFILLEVIVEHNLFAVINNIKLSQDGDFIFKKMKLLQTPVCHSSNNEWLFLETGIRSSYTKCLSILFTEKGYVLNYFVVNQPKSVIENIANKLSFENFCRSGSFLPTAFLKQTLHESLSIQVLSRKRFKIFINEHLRNQLQLAV